MLHQITQLCGTLLNHICQPLFLFQLHSHDVAKQQRNNNATQP
ncbi:Uncharacterised protein [Vibrio cholerae]|nr:Uncharacterised protein [Vibrio cholerae]